MIKKILIVGAGVSGLSAGIYGQLSGFDTEIYEKNAVAGGECTGWNRGGYHFDGCIHWLVGSKPGTPVNKLLQEIGALDDSVVIVNNEYFYCTEADGQALNMYTNVDRLEAHLTELSPEDTPLIRDMCKAIRSLGKLNMPIDKPMDTYSALDNLKMLPKMLPAMRLMKKYSAVTIGEFADQFKHPLIRDAIKQSYPNELIALLPLMIFSSLNGGDSGIPMGGSKKLAERIAKRYTSLGGKIHYNSPVDHIKVENSKAVGVILADGSEAAADVVVSAADGNFTLTHLLEGKYHDEKLRTLYTERSTYPTVTSVHISVGVSCDLSDEPHTVCFKLQRPIDAGGFVHEWLRLDHYCYDRSFAPAGKSVVESAFMLADYDWWKQKAQDPSAYKTEKQRVASEVCAAIEERFPQAKGRIEVADVATPVTYERYCNAWRGSYMSWGPTPKSKIRSLSGKLEGLEDFYMAGQWTMLPGINGAAITGKWTVQRICRDQKIAFREEP